MYPKEINVAKIAAFIGMREKKQKFQIFHDSAHFFCKYFFLYRGMFIFRRMQYVCSLSENSFPFFFSKF